MAKRHHYLTMEIKECDRELARLVRENAPALLDVSGVGAAMASQLLIIIGDNPDRFSGEAQFAALTGVASIPASSGKTTRHRLPRAGDRAANSAIHRIALVRMSTDQCTKDYVAKRTAEGKSKRESTHCLKRYIAREIYRVLRNPRQIPLTSDLRPYRLSMQITLTIAAQYFGLWPSGISPIEQGKNRDHDLPNQYRDWLEKQVLTAA